MSPTTGALNRLAGLREELQTQLWPLPTLGIVAGLILGVVLPRLDAHVDPHLSASTSSYRRKGGVRVREGKFAQ